jgi:hypothetical protein
LGGITVDEDGGPAQFKRGLCGDAATIVRHVSRHWAPGGVVSTLAFRGAGLVRRACASAGVGMRLFRRL